MKLSYLIINIRSNASYLIYNFENLASATKSSFNLYIILNSFFSAFINKIKREFIFNIVVAKANKVLTIRKSRYYIILVYNNEALKNLLFIFVFMFIFTILSISIY